MNSSIHCFIPCSDEAQIKNTVDNMRADKACDIKITLLSTDPAACAPAGFDIIYIDSMNSSATMRKIADAADAEHILLYKIGRAHV